MTPSRRGRRSRCEWLAISWGTFGAGRSADGQQLVKKINECSPSPASSCLAAAGMAWAWLQNPSSITPSLRSANRRLLIPTARPDASSGTS